MKELNWNDAQVWESLSNEKKSDYEPKWQWDCNFKLDFDGPILSVSSRFYPPHKNKHDGWEGTVQILNIDGEVVTEKSFIDSDLDSLRSQVENYVRHLSSFIDVP